MSLRNKVFECLSEESWYYPENVQDFLALQGSLKRKSENHSQWYTIAKTLTRLELLGVVESKLVPASGFLGVRERKMYRRIPGATLDSPRILLKHLPDIPGVLLDMLREPSGKLLRESIWELLSETEGQFCSEIADKLELMGFPERLDMRVFNTCYVWENLGILVGEYEIPKNPGEMRRKRYRRVPGAEMPEPFLKRLITHYRQSKKS